MLRARPEPAKGTPKHLRQRGQRPFGVPQGDSSRACRRAEEPSAVVVLAGGLFNG